MTDYRTEVITSTGGLEQLRGDWDRIHACSRLATPFNSWAWMATWWQVFGDRQWRLHVICIYSDDRLVGILPLYRRRAWHGWSLRFLGTGEHERDEVVTEYCDFLVEPQAEALILQVGWQLLDTEGGWSDFRMSNVLSDSLVASLKTDKIVRSNCGARFRIRLPSSWDKFLAMCSSNMRRQIRVAERDAAGAEVTEEVTRDWKHGGSAAFSVLAQLHQSRWRGKIEPGAFSSTLFTDFHKQIVSHHVDATGCEIRIIRSRGEPLAALYNFGFRDTIYFYQSGVSPVAHFRSPGVYLHCKAMKCAIENNFDYYDLMRGNLSSYKRRFPCEIMEMQNIALYRSRFPVRMFDQVQNYIRRTRKLIM